MDSFFLSASVLRSLSQTSLPNPYWRRQPLDSTGRSRSLINFISRGLNDEDPMLRPLLNDSDPSFFNNGAVSLSPPSSRVVSGQQNQEEQPPPSYTVAPPPPNHPSPLPNYPPPPYNHLELPLYSNLSWFTRFRGYMLREFSCIPPGQIDMSAQINERRSALIIFRAKLAQKKAALARLYTERNTVWNDISRNRTSRAFITQINYITDDIFKTEAAIDKLTNKIEKFELKILQMERALDADFLRRWELQNASRTEQS